MADVVEREQPATGRDPRETLEPMLDDLVRGLGYDKAVVLVYDERSASLRGLFGWNVTDEQARRLALGVPDPIIRSSPHCATGAPQRVVPGTGPALDQNTAATLAEMGIAGFVAAPLRSTTGRSDAPRAVVLLSRKEGVRDIDLEQLAPFAGRRVPPYARAGRPVCSARVTRTRSRGVAVVDGQLRRRPVLVTDAQTTSSISTAARSICSGRATRTPQASGARCG